MPEYTFKHPDASAARQDMEDVVAAFNKSASGQIKVIDYGAARLLVEADAKTFNDFKAQYPDWELYPATYAEIQPPRPNYKNIRKKLGPGEN